MTEALASTDEFFGTSQQQSGLPSATEFFAPPAISGAAHDTVWGSLRTAGGRILDAVGYGAKTGWGSEPLGLSPETERQLEKLNWINDYKNGHQDFMKSANEAIIRPAAALLDLGQRTFTSGAEALGSGLQQSAKEVKGFENAHTNVFPGGGETSGLATILGGTGEILSSVPQGFGVEFAPTATLDVSRARSMGAVGEGERGFYEAVPPSAETTQARAAAANDAGIASPPVLPPVTDIHELARRVDPETFDQFDALAAQKDTYRAQLSEMGTAREALPEARAAQTQIDTILGKVNGIEDRLTVTAKSRLQDARDRLDTLLRTDTPEMSAARDSLMQTDFAMRDLVPQVSDAYRQARDMIPEPLITKPAETAKPGEQAPVAQPQPSAADETVPFLPQKTGAEPAPEPAQGEVVEPPRQRSRRNNMQPVEGTGELKTRGLSGGIEAKAIEEGLVSSFGDLPEYRTVSMADQAALASDMLAKDYDTAKSVALGQKPPPKGILPESLFVAVEKDALARGDVETLRQLATQSKLTTEATTMGQRIRTLGERDQSSPVAAIQEVQNARLADLRRRNIDLGVEREKITQAVRAEIGTQTKKVWEDFISEITCAE